MNPPLILAIIPARAGSQGIPGKNLRRLAGRSLVGWSIAAAQGSRHALRIVVSTDGKEIAAEARRCGAEVVQRPPAISGDSARSEDALLHALDAFDRSEAYRPDLLVFLQCTSPLTRAEDIDGTIDALLEERADTAIAVVPFHYFLWRRDPEGRAIGINHDPAIRLRRQDREPEFLETGAVYVMRTPGFLAARHRFFGKIAMHEMALERRWEIDEPSDLAIAELLLRRQELSAGPALPVKPAAIVFDFDGVMTDDRVLVDEDGKETVSCHRGDGLGLSRLREAGFPLLILSKERNAVVARRAEKLQIPVIQGVDDKAQALSTWAADNQVDLANTIYVANDVNDLPCLSLVGWPVAVADAQPAVLRSARVQLTRPGGRGAVREVCEGILGPGLGASGG